jgi:hypothetical protein
VVDTLGPAFGGVPAPIIVDATGPGGAAVPFVTPTAVDLVDGPRPVTCSHASGEVFPLGTTVVQCFASDASGHQTQTAFGVTVRLAGASSSITNAVATLSLLQLSPTSGTVIEATSAGNGNTGNTFRYDPGSGQYTYNLSTKSLSAGTRSLRIDLPDGVVRAVTIALRD